VTLNSPAEGDAGNKMIFTWTSDPVEAQLAFEPVIWIASSAEELMAHGMSPSGMVDSTSVSAEISTLEGQPGLGLASGSDYYWGVCIVQKNPYKRLYCTEGRRIRYEGAGGGDGGSGEGGGIDEG
jgi:hypothetical protein